MAGRSDKKRAEQPTTTDEQSVIQDRDNQVQAEEVIDEGADTCCQEQDEIASLKDQVARQGESIVDLKDQLLRKQADFDNFRKRMFREKEESIKYANSTLLQDLVSVIDDFERAIASAEKSQDFTAFLSGIQLIERQFAGMLERNWGLKRMETIGNEFDPQKHEALMMEECADCSTQTVIEDFQKGYYLHDRVLRHAKVKVGIPAPAVADERAAEQENK